MGDAELGGEFLKDNTLILISAIVSLTTLGGLSLVIGGGLPGPATTLAGVAVGALAGLVGGHLNGGQANTP